MVVKGYTKAEVEFKAAQQLATWGEQEAKRREKERQLNLVSDLKSKAEIDNQNAQERLAALHEILGRGLKGGKKFDWKAMKNNGSMLSCV